jgi:hypothetical protein
MTAKEKAIELVNAMGMSTHYLNNYTGGDDIPVYRNQYAKQCAFIAVNEIIDAIDWHSFETPTNFNYWHEVKAEIEKLK